MDHLLKYQKHPSSYYNFKINENENNYHLLLDYSDINLSFFLVYTVFIYLFLLLLFQSCKLIMREKMYRNHNKLIEPKFTIDEYEV